MRKIIASVNISMDGFMAGPRGELDWHFRYWNNEMSEFLSGQLGRTDIILLGRVTYSAMAGYWPAAACRSSSAEEDIAFAVLMNTIKKIVVSKKPALPPWNNSAVIRGNIKKEIQRLRAQSGKDVIIYGSGQLIAYLMRLGLIDEYMLWVHPVALGRGKPLFKGLKAALHMQLRAIKAFATGVVVLSYNP